MNRKSQSAPEIILKHHYFISMTQTERMPASTILLISASPILDGTHSSSWLATTVAFFGFTAPFFGAISQIWFEIGGGSKCGYESGNARAKDEGKMAKWQRWERRMRRRGYKALSPPFRIQGFLGNRSRDLRSSKFSNVA